MHSMTGGRIALIGLLAVLAWPAETLGYNQTKTCNESGPYACESGEKPKALHWNARCVRYRVNQDGTNNFVSSGDGPAIDELRRAVYRSYEVWNEVACTDLTLVDGGLTNTSNANYDADETESNRNLVVFRDQGWAKVASARAFALTSVTYNPSNGVIADADIEVNTEFYKFTSAEEPQANHVDVRNTMTHEVGHFVGLDHTDINEATMYGTAPVGETAKRTLHPDDIKGVCATYPSNGRSSSLCDDESDFPPREDLSSGGICAVTDPDHPTPTGLALVLVGLAAFAVVRRRT